MLRTHQADCRAQTSAVPDFVDITESVQEVLQRSGIRGGQVTLFCCDEHCRILVNEFESGLLADLTRTVRRSGDGLPRAAIGARSVAVPATDGSLRLGTWQRLLLVELDRAATRSVVVQVLGEA